MTEDRAQTIAHFVGLALSWVEYERTQGYPWIILCLASQIGELLEERAETRLPAQRPPQGVFPSYRRGGGPQGRK